MVSSINTSGAGRGSVSLQTQYDKAKADTALAVQKQQRITKRSSLLKANESLTAQLNKPLYIGNSEFAEGVSPSTMAQQVIAYQTEIDYEQTMVTTGVWGSNVNQNLVTAARASTSTNVGSLTLSDKTKIINDITYLMGSKTKVESKIKSINASIANNKKLFDSLNSTTTTTSTSGAGLSTKTGDKGTQTQKPTAPPEFPTSDYVWNLPPHKWSLPVDPYSIAPDTTNKRTDSFHSTRRGRIWFYNGYVGPTNIPDYANTGTPSGQNPVTVNKYGFQFIWNPETFSQNTAVNMNVTPSGSDPSIALTGFAAANSTMNFTLRLDRTNDFTSMLGGNAISKAVIQKNSDNKVANDTIATVNAALGTNAFKLRPIVPVFDPAWLDYYKEGQPVGTTPTAIEQQIKDLLTYGTEADLEYLYRTVNGSGWKGIGGRETSNIGYLMPALIRLDLGQQKFVGVVSSVEVNHLAFTRDLVPIRTDVNISVDLRANIQPQTNNGAVGR